MVIREKAIFVLYRADCGLDVIVKQNPNGNVSVSSLDHLRGSGVNHGNYKTRTGAMIAIGKIFGKGKYHFVSQWSE